jgi:methanogenic corrinoid protein MtbC1
MNGRPDERHIPIGHVVAELSVTYPDVTHSSLRFLEREGLVEPQRTPGGHRLYTERDIFRIRQIKEWQKQRLSLETIRAKLKAADQLSQPGELAREFLDLATSGNLPAAQHLILDADELGLPLDVIFENVLKSALYELGYRWQAGELNVGQEKEVSALVRDLVAQLSLRHAAPISHPESIVAACVAGEFHEIGLRMVVGLLHADGYLVHYLGPNVDPRFLVESVSLRRPALVLLSATLPEHLPAVKQAVDTLRAQLLPGMPPRVAVGGQVTQDYGPELAVWDLVVSENNHVMTVRDTVLSALVSNGYADRERAGVDMLGEFH